MRNNISTLTHTHQTAPTSAQPAFARSAAGEGVRENKAQINAAPQAYDPNEIYYASGQTRQEICI